MALIEPCPQRSAHAAHVYKWERRSPVFGRVLMEYGCPGVTPEEAAPHEAERPYGSDL